MTDFKKYIDDSKKLKSMSLMPQTTNTISTAISKEINGFGGSIISSDDTAKFSKSLSELAVSDEVITELSNEIGTPRSNETEDEFVERAKSAFGSILKRKLSNKI